MMYSDVYLPVSLGAEECLSTEFTCEDGTCIDSRRECGVWWCIVMYDDV